MKNTILYTVNTGLYINLTNRCPCDCSFCIRNNADGMNLGESLWLTKEPSIPELTAALTTKLTNNTYTEAVFCGYGEPTERLDAVLAVAAHIKSINHDIPVRLNTNGLSDLINNKKTAAELSANIDSCSISLNAPTKEDYAKLCRPAFGEKSFQAVLDFAREANLLFGDTCLTAVNVLSPHQLVACEALANSLGIRFRIRGIDG